MTATDTLQEPKDLDDLARSSEADVADLFESATEVETPAPSSAAPMASADGLFVREAPIRMDGEGFRLVVESVADGKRSAPRAVIALEIETAAGVFAPRHKDRIDHAAATARAKFARAGAAAADRPELVDSIEPLLLALSNALPQLVAEREARILEPAAGDGGLRGSRGIARVPGRRRGGRRRRWR